MSWKGQKRGYGVNSTPPGSANTFASTTNMVQPSLEEGRGTTVVPIKQAQDYAFFHTKKFPLVFIAMCFIVICFALDQFIITVAVPQIVSQFDSLDKECYDRVNSIRLNTAFFIPCAASIGIYTQLMTITSAKWCYLGAMVIFEVGSAVCGAATSMDMLIVGRAIAGLGGAGLWNATWLIGGDLIPFERRPSLFALWGLSYIAASVMGPLVGGAFTDMGIHGWRWCFYINLPIGGFAFALCFLLLPRTPLMPNFDGLLDKRPTWLKVLRIDWISAILTLGFVTCIGVGLQWGGISRSWSDAGVITTLVLSPVCLIALFLWSFYMGPRAMLPMDLMRRKHFCAGISLSFFGFGIVVCLLYYLSIYYEAIKGTSAVRAGVLLLGLQLSMCPVFVIVGKVAERTGQAKYIMVTGAIFCAVASGLLTMTGRTTSVAEMVGFEVLVGFGLGFFIQIMIVHMQADYLDDPHLVPHATNVFNFWGFVGRVIGLSVATSIFENKLHIGLEKLGLPLAIQAAVEASPNAIREDVPESLVDTVLDVYATALSKVWWLTLAYSIAALVAALCVKNLNHKALGEKAAEARRVQTSPEYPMQATSSDDDIDVKH